MANAPPRGWREPRGSSCRAVSLMECARVLGARYETLDGWKRKGWLAGAEAKGGLWKPREVWKIWRARWEEHEGRPAPVAVEVGPAGEVDEEEKARRREVVRYAEYWQARKIMEEGEKAAIAAAKARLELEQLKGRLVTTESVRDAFRELAGAMVVELQMMAGGTWVEAASRFEAERAAMDAGRRLQQMADEIVLDRAAD